MPATDLRPFSLDKLNAGSESSNSTGQSPEISEGLEKTKLKIETLKILLSNYNYFCKISSKSDVRVFDLVEMTMEDLE